MNYRIVFMISLTIINPMIFASQPTSPRIQQATTPRNNQFSPSNYQELATIVVTEYIRNNNLTNIKFPVSPSNHASHAHICAALSTDENLTQAPLDTKVIILGLQFRQSLPKADKRKAWSFDPFYSLVHTKKLWL